MKILICTPFDLSVPRGNAIAAGRLARGFNNRGHAAEILAGPDAVAEESVRRRLADARPDAVLVLQAAYSAGAVRAAAADGRARVVLALRGTDANEMLDDPAIGPAALEAIRLAHAVTVFNDVMRDAVAARVPGKATALHVVPNGLEFPVSDVDYRSRLGVPRNAVVFAALCGLRAVKRPVELLEWLDPVVQRSPGLVLIHAGPVLEPEVGDRFHGMADARPWVHRTGVIPHDETDSFLRAADVYVSASRSEGMPHAVREAMAAGLPLLLSDIPGHRRMAAGAREAFFYDSPASFAAGALSLAGDPERRQAMGAAARERIERELAGYSETDAYLALLSQPG
ncbi:MAG: glycosyltransferase family 4 protein [Acidobacteria bacterium]|nr:glycosyltransferase family 4 protein [Acidobacteriota bacterium]